MVLGNGTSLSVLHLYTHDMSESYGEASAKPMSQVLQHDRLGLRTFSEWDRRVPVLGRFT